jgi:prolyl oligopeptidase
MVAPVARVEVVRETHFGVSVDDPYRWMEEPSAEYDSWLVGQAACAGQFLDGLPQRKALLERIGQLRRGEPGLRTLVVAGGLVFALREAPRAGVAVLVARRAAEQTGRVLFDPNQVAGAEHRGIDW